MVLRGETDAINFANSTPDCAGFLVSMFGIRYSDDANYETHLEYIPIKNIAQLTPIPNSVILSNDSEKLSKLNIAVFYKKTA
jgi:hypothetical protein